MKIVRGTLNIWYLALERVTKKLYASLVAMALLISFKNPLLYNFGFVNLFVCFITGAQNSLYISIRETCFFFYCSGPLRDQYSSCIFCKC